MGAPTGVIRNEVEVLSGARVYVPDHGNDRVQYFTSTGDYLGQWGGFSAPTAIDITDDGTVFVCDFGKHRVTYSSGEFGEYGDGPGQFDGPAGVAVKPDASRVYVTDFGNHRVQYFDLMNVNIEPSSAGRVKALFR